MFCGPTEFLHDTDTRTNPASNEKKVQFMRGSQVKFRIRVECYGTAYTREVLQVGRRIGCGGRKGGGNFIFGEAPQAGASVARHLRTSRK